MVVPDIFAAFAAPLFVMWSVRNLGWPVDQSKLVQSRPASTTNLVTMKTSGEASLSYLLLYLKVGALQG
jgi:hypothetical protein